LLLWRISLFCCDVLRCFVVTYFVFFVVVTYLVVLLLWRISLFCCDVFRCFVVVTYFVVLLLCYNRTHTFLLTEFFLTSKNVMDVSFYFVCRVCNSIDYIIRKTYTHFVVLSRYFFVIPCGRTCSTTWKPWT